MPKAGADRAQAAGLMSRWAGFSIRVRESVANRGWAVAAEKADDLGVWSLSSEWVSELSDIGKQIQSRGTARSAPWRGGVAAGWRYPLTITLAYSGLSDGCSASRSTNNSSRHLLFLIFGPAPHIGDSRLKAVWRFETDLSGSFRIVCPGGAGDGARVAI